MANLQCATGLPLLDAGRKVTDLLTRNLLKAVGVWWCASSTLAS